MVKISFLIKIQKYLFMMELKESIYYISQNHMIQHPHILWYLIFMVLEVMLQNLLKKLKCLKHLNHKILFWFFPQGTLLDGLSHWNAALNSTDNKSTVNDIDFIQNLITHLSSEYAVDTSRIYACGYSNGAMFSYALACYTENKIAAIGSISGTLIDTSSSCSPSHEIPLIKFHGTQDQVLPFSGNSDYFSVFDIIDFWRYKNNILGESDTLNLISDNNFGISKILHLDNNNNISIENYIVTNGGHEWFNFNIENHNISELVLDFFNNYDINGKRNQ